MDLPCSVLLWGIVIYLGYVVITKFGLVQKFNALGKRFDAGLADLFRAIAYLLAQRDPYREGNYRYIQNFVPEEYFTTKTAAGFKVRYELRLICARVNNQDFNRCRMLDESRQKALVEDFNNSVFLPFLEERNCFFHLEWLTTIEGRMVHQIFRSAVCRLQNPNGASTITEYAGRSITHDLSKKVFKECGCECKVPYFNTRDFPNELIDENYAMLTEEQKLAVLEDERYGAYEEWLAVGAMKRTLDFFRHTSSKHEADMFSIETDKAGRCLKLKWMMKTDATSAYYLLGFRKTNGFGPDQFSETENGTLVIHARNDGEVVEVLEDGTAYFYTFFLKPWKEDQRSFRCDPLRFQLTIETEEETALIQETLQRLRPRQSEDEDRVQISKALKELGFYVELDTALETRMKVWEKQIMDNEDYSAEQKTEKIERVRDAMTILRSKYEPV